MKSWVEEDGIPNKETIPSCRLSILGKFGKGARIAKICKSRILIPKRIDHLLF
jgi:hypothetical protein